MDAICVCDVPTVAIRLKMVDIYSINECTEWVPFELFNLFSAAATAIRGGADSTSSIFAGYDFFLVATLASTTVSRVPVYCRTRRLFRGRVRAQTIGQVRQIFLGFYYLTLLCDIVASEKRPR